MQDESIAAPVREYMRRTIGQPIADDEDVFHAGYANSLFAMQLVAFVEKTFGIEIDGEDLELDNFRSVNAVSRFIARKQMAAA